MTATEAGTDRSDSDGAGTGPTGTGSSSGELAPAADIVVRRRRVHSRQRKLTVWQIVATVVFVAVLAALVWVGYSASLRVGGGTEARVTDPGAPGYLAEPRPTPTDLYVVTDDSGEFASALVVVPDGSGSGGTAVPVPPSFIVPAYADSPPLFLRDVYADGGIDGIRDRLGVALQFRLGSAEVVPPSTLAALAGGEPIVVENVDNLRDPEDDTSVVYPAGALEIVPEELADFLAFEGGGDPAPNQALRAQAVWQQLFERSAGSELAELPAGESAEGSEGPGFGAAVDSLVSGQVNFDSVPMAEVPVPDSYFVAWMPDEANLNTFVARVVPLPESPAPGIRTPVAILDGTNTDTAISAAVPAVVRSGGEVTVVGNADTFDVAATTVGYTGDNASVADAIAAELDVTASEADGPIEGASVRVVIGSDRVG